MLQQPPRRLRCRVASRLHRAISRRAAHARRRVGARSRTHLRNSRDAGAARGRRSHRQRHRPRRRATLSTGQGGKSLRRDCLERPGQNPRPKYWRTRASETRRGHGAGRRLYSARARRVRAGGRGGLRPAMDILLAALLALAMLVVGFALAAFWFFKFKIKRWYLYGLAASINKFPR